MSWRIGVIGGSGLYALDGLEAVATRAVATPWGDPSDTFVTGTLDGVEFVFLPRHGRGHAISPDAVNARANVDAFKRLGCTDLVAISSVGSLSDALPPGSFAVVDQLIDRTHRAPRSFFGPGCVAHVSLAEPTCPRLSALAADAFVAAGATVVRGATYLAMEGPSFSTRAESRLYRHWGADVIGMTAMPEARLAREAELPYALVGMVTDFDAWREEEAAVSLEEILGRVAANVAVARAALPRLAAALPRTRAPSPIDTALDGAILTAPSARDPALLARLDAVAGRVL